MGWVQKYFGIKVYFVKEDSMYKFSKASIAKLKTCHPLLQVIALEAIKEIDFVVIEGARTTAKQQEIYKIGRRGVAGEKPVTWIDGITKKSKHNHTPSLAMDLAPYIDRKIPWNDTKAFDALAAVIMRIAQENATPLVWGGSWKRFKDRPHFELSSVVTR